MSQLLEEEEESLWYVCKFCRRVFPKKRLLIIHRRVDHPEFDREKKKNFEKVGSLTMNQNGGNGVPGKIRWGPNVSVGGVAAGGSSKWTKKTNDLGTTEGDGCGLKISKIIVLDSSPSTTSSSSSTNKMTRSTGSNLDPSKISKSPQKIFRNATEALLELRLLPQKFIIMPPTLGKPVGERNGIKFSENLPLTRQEVERAFKKTAAHDLPKMNSKTTSYHHPPSSKWSMTNDDKLPKADDDRNLCTNGCKRFDDLFTKIGHIVNCPNKMTGSSPTTPSHAKVGGRRLNRLESSGASSSTSSSSKSGSCYAGEKFLRGQTKQKLEGRAYWLKLFSQNRFEVEVKSGHFGCRYCPKLFSNIDGRLKHEKMGHPNSTDKKLTLHSTKKGFSIPDDLNQNVVNCDKIMRRRMKKMTKQFEPDQFLQKILHQNILHKMFTKKPFDGGMVHVCQFCCKVFHDPRLALNHAKIHEGENGGHLKMNGGDDQQKSKKGWMRETKWVNEYDDDEVESEATTAYFEEEYQNTVYCVCSGFAYGDMIACENEKCAMEWFHFDCVGLRSKPKGHWYCPDCEPKFIHLIQTDGNKFEMGMPRNFDGINGAGI